mmetsp:Transcript_247/g.1045  ORF Transcript_247/g.1045 Transcript_247/m.1045 type:complete len:287 (+) Transcript_247:486-1346(+)
MVWRAEDLVTPHPSIGEAGQAQALLQEPLEEVAAPAAPLDLPLPLSGGGALRLVLFVGLLVVLELLGDKGQVGLQFLQLLERPVQAGAGSLGQGGQFLAQVLWPQPRSLLHQLLEHKVQHVEALEVALVGLRLAQPQQALGVHPAGLVRGSGLRAVVHVVEHEHNDGQQVPEDGGGLQLPTGALEQRQVRQGVADPLLQSAKHGQYAKPLRDPGHRQQQQQPPLHVPEPGAIAPAARKLLEGLELLRGRPDLQQQLCRSVRLDRHHGRRRTNAAFAADTVAGGRGA